MSDIIWPERYTPGTTDNYVSNEVVVKGLTAAQIWPYLNTPSYWPTYYTTATPRRFSFTAAPGQN